MIRLKFDTNKIPFSLECTLKDEYGFHQDYYSYQNATIIYKKHIGPPKATNFNDLSDLVIADLLKRLNRITDCFQDLEASRSVAALRCRTMASMLEPKAKAFCHDWIKRNLEGKAYGSEDGPKSENLKLELLS